jgi:hypothetical protein
MTFSQMRNRIIAFLAIVAAGTASFGTEQVPLAGFQRAGEFGEQERWTRLESGVRVYVIAPSGCL